MDCGTLGRQGEVGEQLSGPLCLTMRQAGGALKTPKNVLSIEHWYFFSRMFHREDIFWVREVLFC